MEISGVIERVRRVATVSESADAARDDLEAALRSVTQLEARCASRKARLAQLLAAQVSFPEQAIGDCTRGSARDGLTTKERADLLDKLPEFADALDNGDLTAGHVDAITRAGKNLTEQQHAELIERVAELADVAAVSSVREFKDRLDREVKLIQRDDAMSKLDRQRRATSMRTWTDSDDMFCINGRFDPVLGVKLAAQIAAAREARFAGPTPEWCPTDPFAKQDHLTALAVADLILGQASVATGRPEFTVVIDADLPNTHGGPTTDWGISVELPDRILAELASDGDVSAVIVRNGVVLHAPGQLDLGRSSRLANRAQRRAMKAIYRTCAVPGCSVHIDRCKLHHIIEWENGGLTNFANLLPVCPHHHAMIHANGWKISLGANRELTISLPDGTVLSTGPPSRRAA